MAFEIGDTGDYWNRLILFIILLYETNVNSEILVAKKLVFILNLRTSPGPLSPEAEDMVNRIIHVHV